MEQQQQQQQPLSVANLLRRHAAELVARYPGQAVPQVQSTLAKLSLCRTAAMGARRFRCDSCAQETTVYNSCGDRHCPLCAGAKRSDWLVSTSELLLPGVDYFQVVFTIPSELSSLALGNRRELYNLLFHSAWRSLRDTIADEHGFEAAAVMVLHTWNQKLDAHAHVHAVVPGGGSALQGCPRWIRSEHRSGRRFPGHWLVDADELRLRFRTAFLKGLRRLHARGELKLDGNWKPLRHRTAFDDFLAPLQQIDWVTYIEPPPHEDCSPQNVLKYLARYLTGGPISDRRLLSADNGMVTFLARSGTQHGGNRTQEPVPLSGCEFVRRWSLHILPKGYTKTRRFGGYSNRHRRRYLAVCRALLSDISEFHHSNEAVPDPIDSSVNSETETDIKDQHRCRECGDRLTCLSSTNRPGWFAVMNSPHRPAWYDDG